MASVTWGRLGGFALVACAVAVGAVSGPAAGARPVSTSTSVSAEAAVRAQSPAALTAATRLIPRCTGGQLRVRADGYAVGTGHVVDIIGLWNAGPVCKLAGWRGCHRQVKRGAQLPVAGAQRLGLGRPSDPGKPADRGDHSRTGGQRGHRRLQLPGVTALRARHRSGGCRSPRQEPGW